MTPTTTYRSLPGFFLQEESGTDNNTFEYSTTNFGLIPRSYPTDTPESANTPQWTRLETYIHHLRATAPPGTTYKLIWLGRHGQGHHNLEESRVGRKEWDDHYSKLPQFLDAELTDLGRSQAKIAHDAFVAAWNGGMPRPASYYVSPHARCLETCKITFHGLGAPEFRPVIKEMLREESGIHTCDKRRSRQWIESGYPDWEFEEGFSEEDVFFSPDVRESSEELRVRCKGLLDDVFEHDKNAFVSFETHSAWIRDCLWNLEHPWGKLGRFCKIPTGAVLPVLVEAKTVHA